ncbi:MAG: S8 family serine peptidase [Candidatus Heimdallarchaeota archaeon]|nr:S8 family serine peptidase [Candidatus Heimdallarchaeota archaeon]
MNLIRTTLTFVIITSMILVSISSKESVVDPTYAADYEGDWHHRLIKSNDAWDITQGRKEIVVAIIDSGVDFSHPDLINTQWINVGEIADNSIDDDGNGYVDDVYGWDFISNDSNPGPTSSDPVNWHATFIAGIIAAPKDDFGVVGIAPNVTIMNVRILDVDNYVYSYETFGDAIRYAAENGADVINLSIIASDNSSLYMDEIEYANSLNIPVVAATGNSDLSVVAHPAKSDNVIAVGASNRKNEKADYSNYGEETELVAPVGDANEDNIRSTVPPDQYGTGWGTSFAGPQVSATIALMKSLNDSLSVAEIRDILHKSAKDLGDPGHDILTGYGLLNVLKAVQAVLDPSILLPNDSTYQLLAILPALITLTLVVFRRKNSCG